MFQKIHDISQEFFTARILFKGDASLGIDAARRCCRSELKGCLGCSLIVIICR